jgi:hypothetical protein
MSRCIGSTIERLWPLANSLSVNRGLTRDLHFSERDDWRWNSVDQCRGVILTED